MAVVVDRHQGPAVGEQELVARMRADGLDPRGWGNGPGDTYGWHEHSYEKVLYCVRGLIHGTRRRSAPRGCAASKRPASLD